MIVATSSEQEQDNFMVDFRGLFQASIRLEYISSAHVLNAAEIQLEHV